jgi:hypothetical protein
MKRSVVAAAFYAAFITYSLLTLFLGETGVVALNRLEESNGHLEVNMTDLEERGAELSSRLESLMRNPEAIVVEARSLGLYRQDDSVVVFRNLESRRRITDAGRVLRMASAPSVDENVFLILAAAAGIATLFVALALRRSDHVRASRSR